MKSVPEDFDPVEYPELACIQAILHDEDSSPEGKRARLSCTVATPVPVCHQWLWVSQQSKQKA